MVDDKYYYFRIGGLVGRAGQMSHVAFESGADGGRLIIADAYKHTIYEQEMDVNTMESFFGWLMARIMFLREKRIREKR